MDPRAGGAPNPSSGCDAPWVFTAGRYAPRDGGAWTYRECVFRNALWTLRQPRYAKLAALMFIIALICVAAGTWQISRFEQSVRDNNVLDGNARAAVAPLTTTPVVLVNQGSALNRDAIRFRTVAASGTYAVGKQEFLRNQSLNGVSGYYVLNPLRTATGVLLVVRGFVADNGPPTTVEAPLRGSCTSSVACKPLRPRMTPRPRWVRVRSNRSTRLSRPPGWAHPCTRRT